jgi:hypothetical protein
MATFECKKCGLYMGEMDKGKIRNGHVILCSSCWEDADAAIQIMNFANHTPDQQMPGFLEDLFGKFKR